MHFVEKKKYFFKENEAKQRVTPLCQPTQMEAFHILFLSSQEQYKVLISKPVADKKRGKKTTDNRVEGKTRTCRKNYFTEQTFPDLFCRCSLSSKFPPQALFWVAKKLFWVPITEYGLRKECRIPRATPVALRIYYSPWKRSPALFRIKKEKRNQVIFERHDIPRVLESPFLFSSENTETKQI